MNRVVTNVSLKSFCDLWDILAGGISLIIMVIVGIIAIVLGAVYFQYIYRHIYEISTNHLVEVYEQVNYSFEVLYRKIWEFWIAAAIIYMILILFLPMGR